VWCVCVCIRELLLTFIRGTHWSDNNCMCIFLQLAPQCSWMPFDGNNNNNLWFWFWFWFCVCVCCVGLTFNTAFARDLLVLSVQSIKHTHIYCEKKSHMNLIKTKRNSGYVCVCVCMYAVCDLTFSISIIIINYSYYVKYILWWFSIIIIHCVLFFRLLIIINNNNNFVEIMCVCVCVVFCDFDCVNYIHQKTKSRWTSTWRLMQIPVESNTIMTLPLFVL